MLNLVDEPLIIKHIIDRVINHSRGKLPFTSLSKSDYSETEIHRVSGICFDLYTEVRFVMIEVTLRYQLIDNNSLCSFGI